MVFIIVSRHIKVCDTRVYCDAFLPFIDWKHSKYCRLIHSHNRLEQGDEKEKSIIVTKEGRGTGIRRKLFGFFRIWHGRRHKNQTLGSFREIESEAKGYAAAGGSREEKTFLIPFLSNSSTYASACSFGVPLPFISLDRYPKRDGARIL